MFSVFSAKELPSDMTFGGIAQKRFTNAKKPITLEFIKGTLLVIADQMVGTISDVIQENAEFECGGEYYAFCFPATFVPSGHMTSK